MEVRPASVNSGLPWAVVPLSVVPCQEDLVHKEQDTLVNCICLERPLGPGIPSRWAQPTIGPGLDPWQTELWFLCELESCAFVDKEVCLHDTVLLVAVQDKLDQMVFIWENIHVLVEEREAKLLDVMELAEKFWCDHLSLVVTTKDMQDFIRDLEDPGIDPSVVKQQQEAAEVSQVSLKVKRTRRSGKNAGFL